MSSRDLQLWLRWVARKMRRRKECLVSWDCRANRCPGDSELLRRYIPAGRIGLAPTTKQSNKSKSVDLHIRNNNPRPKLQAK
jgi:hypothetical protein